jgi:hypothetical protein
MGRWIALMGHREVKNPPPQEAAWGADSLRLRVDVRRGAFHLGWGRPRIGGWGNVLGKSI